MTDRIYPEDLLRKGGPWLGALRNRIKWLRPGGGNESLMWGSEASPTPPFTMREVEELAAEAAAAALNEAAARIRAEAEQLAEGTVRQALMRAAEIAEHATPQPINNDE